MKNAPTLDQWKQLYHYADKIKEMAPWNWMYESDIFGVSLPEYEENFYVSILGNAGEYFAFCLLQGDVALGVLDFISNYDIDAPGLTFYMTQLQISFENREYCQKQDFEVMKKLGLKYRGRNAYPTFRAMHAGHLPYFIDKNEAQILLEVLKKSLEMLEQLRDEKEKLLQYDDKKIFFLVKTETGEWKNEYRLVPNVILQEQATEIPHDLIKKIKDMPRRDGIAEIDLYPAPATIKDEEGRPYVPLAVMIADQQSGGILTIELLPPGSDFLNFMETLPGHILRIFQQLKIMPVTFQMTENYLNGVFQMIFDRLSLNLEIVDHLPNIEMIKRSMKAFFQSRH